MKFKKFINEMDVDLTNGELTKAEPAPTANPPDVIKMDIPLFIRTLEYAKENAKTDQELHQLTERAAAMSRDRTLTMEDYEALVAELRREPDDPNSKPPKEYATLKRDVESLV